MILIGSLTSPYVRKVRIVAAEKKIDLRFELENVWSPDTRIARHNPLGKIPVLVLEDGATVYDSRVIVEFLDQLTPVHRLIPPSGRARTDVKCLEALADGILDACVLIRLEETQRPEGQRSTDWVARQQAKIEAGVAALADTLGERDWFLDNKYGLADLAAGVALGYLDFRYAAFDWRAAHPNLAKLADKVFRRPSFAGTLPPAA